MKTYCTLLLALAWPWGVWAADEIIIGQTADFSSVAGVQMKDFNGGAQAYINKINASGGIKGHLIKLFSLDDAFAADKAAQNARDLIQTHKAIALFGTRGSDPSEAVMKVAESAGIPLIAPITGADSVRNSVVTFPVRAGYRTEIESMLKHISIVPSRVAILVQNDKFGQPLANYISERIAKEYRAITLTKQVSFDRKSTDLRQQVTDILSSQADGIIALCNPSSCESFVKELLSQTHLAQRPRPTVYQTSISDVYAQYKKLGPDVVAGNPYSQVLPDPHRTLNALTKEYMVVAAHSHLQVNYRSFEGYASAKVLVTALSRASKLTAAGVQEAMENMGSLDLGGLVVRYSGNDHQGSRYVDLVTLDRFGKLVH
jgi:branched-chain amino acid transport system substrate-binding protein